MVGVATKVAAFTAVTVQRACHNSFIEWAKGDAETSLYTTSSVIFVAQAVCLFFSWELAYSHGDMKAVRKCFNPATLWRFAHIGLIYTMGDILEMESVNYMDSNTYTVLSQSKLLVTALFMWMIDGKGQSLLQWFLLLTVTSGMLEYVLVGKMRGGVGMSFTSLGVVLAFVKVTVSCYVAVLNQKALHEDKNSFPVQFASLQVVRASSSLAYMVIKDGILGSGDMFGLWTWRTAVLCFAGFVCNTVLNQFLLKILGAIMKNFSEAIGVMLVYFWRILFLGAAFDTSVFNAEITVVMACISYLMTKRQPPEGSKASDIGDELAVESYQGLGRAFLPQTLRSRC